MAVLSPPLTVRVISVAHTDHHIAGHLVQDAVANAQLQGWAIQSVVRTDDLTSHTYEITTSCAQLVQSVLAA